MHRSVARIFLILSAGCASAGNGQTDDKKDEEVPSDKNQPVLVIEAPERGTVLPGERVTVKGRATDGETAIDSLTINGSEEIELAGDGSFEAEVQVEAGITTLETVAIDGGGNEMYDRRAVLAGSFAPQGQTIDDAVVAHIGEPALDVLEGLLTDYVENQDFASFVPNPFVSGGGSCLGYEGDLFGIDRSAITTDISFTQGGIEVTATAHDVRADGEVRYKAACLGPYTEEWYLSADAYQISGKVGLSIDASGQFALSLGDLSGAWDNFAFDDGPLTTVGLAVFVGDVSEEVNSILLDRIRAEIEPTARTFLAELEFGEWTVDSFGRPLTFTVEPTLVSFDEMGGKIALDATISIDGLQMGDYVKTPALPPGASILAAGGRGFRVALSDDVANQVLAAFWAAGDMDQTTTIPEGSPVKATLGDAVEKVDTYFLLPPMAQVDPESGTARVSFGDVIVDALDAEGEIVNRFFISGEVDLQVTLGPDLRISLTTGTPDLMVGILEETGANLLTEDQLEALASFTIADMTDYADSLLADMPIPTLAESILTAPSLDASRGYLLLDADVTPMF